MKMLRSARKAPAVDNRKEIFELAKLHGGAASSQFQALLADDAHEITFHSNEQVRKFVALILVQPFEDALAHLVAEHLHLLDQLGAGGRQVDPLGTAIR